MAKTPGVDRGLGPLLGIDMYERATGFSRCRLTVRPEVLNPHGVLHGAALYALADQGMGSAVYSRLDESESCATVEIKMVYIAPVVEGVVDCETRLISKGRRIAVLESELRNGERLVAKALGTFAIFPERSQQGAG
ncbi:MAG: PaaI family thioesterase [Dehalococcoidia bacterium]|nr:PaaI family thioesterase [Dehalococcoidia bacterium]